MSFLENKLNEKDSFIAPFKDGGINGLGSTKIWGRIGIPIYTFPLFHHSFSFWKEYINSNINQIMTETSRRCEAQCKIDAQSTHGSYIQPGNEILSSCFAKCRYQWHSSIEQHMNNLEKKTETEFNKCIGNAVKQIVTYDNVLKCKKVGFEYYMNKHIEFEQEYIKAALKVYA